MADSIRFAVVGDTQGEDSTIVSETAFSKIVQHILAAEPAVDFVVLTGDLINGSRDGDTRYEEFQYWRSLAAPWYTSNFLGLKVYPAPGNHDQESSLSYLDTWQKAFPELPDNGPDNGKKMTYSFNMGSCHFVLLNTSTPTLFRKHSVDVDWLEEDLNANTQPIIFVFGHEPAYPAQRHIGKSLDDRPTRRDKFWQTLVNFGAKAYFCGHEHVYDHWIKDGVHQIVDGSGGVPSSYIIYSIVDVDDSNNILISVYNAADNSLRDQFDLADTDGVPCEEREPETKSIYDIVDNSLCMLFLVFLTPLACLGIQAITLEPENRPSPNTRSISDNGNSTVTKRKGL
jgi:3',5'-cyclic AMP phosphodiesterase CpdA